MSRVHYWYAQILPLRLNKVICEHCAKVVPIGKWPTGKRRKCPGTKGRPQRGKR